MCDLPDSPPGPVLWGQGSTPPNSAYHKGSVCCCSLCLTFVRADIYLPKEHKHESICSVTRRSCVPGSRPGFFLPMEQSSLESQPCERRPPPAPSPGGPQQAQCWGEGSTRPSVWGGDRFTSKRHVEMQASLGRTQARSGSHFLGHWGFQSRVPAVLPQDTGSARPSRPLCATAGWVRAPLCSTKAWPGASSPRTPPGPASASDPQTQPAPIHDTVLTVDRSSPAPSSPAGS